MNQNTKHPKPKRMSVLKGKVEQEREKCKVVGIDSLSYSNVGEMEVWEEELVGRIF